MTAGRSETHSTQGTTMNSNQNQSSGKRRHGSRRGPLAATALRAALALLAAAGSARAQTLTAPPSLKTIAVPQPSALMK